MRAGLPLDIDVRIGVNTGEVVTGSGGAARDGRRRQRGCPPRAGGRSRARCCSARRPTQLVRDAVDVEMVEPLRLKGKAQPVKAYRLARR